MQALFKISIREPYMGNQVPLKVLVTYYPGKGWHLLVHNPEGIAHTGKLLATDETGSIIDLLRAGESDGD